MPDGAAALADRLPPWCPGCNTQHEAGVICNDGAGVLPKDRHAQRQLAAELFSSEAGDESTPEDEPTPEERGRLRAKSYAIFGVDPVRAVVEECETIAGDPAASEEAREEALAVRESAQRAEPGRTDTVHLCEGLERARAVQRQHEYGLHLQKQAAEKASPPPNASPPPPIDRAPRPAARRTPARDGRTARPAARRTSRVTRAGPSSSSSSSDDPPQQPDLTRPAATAMVVTGGAGILAFTRTRGDARVLAEVVKRAIRQHGGFGLG